MNSVEKKNKKISDILGNFIYKYKFLLISVFFVIILFIVGFGITRIVLEKNKVKSAKLAESILDAKEEYEAEEDVDKKEELETSYLALIESIKNENNNNYAEFRAIFEEAIFYEESDKGKALNCFLEFKNKKGKNYLIPLALHKAAIISEELGKEVDDIIDLYKIISNKFYDIYIDIDRVNFNIGRLYEKKGEEKEALKYYNKIIDKFEDENIEDLSEWYKFAKDRVFYIEAN